ncbi:hypothetical protein C8F01DRAFT_495122 [Mycena amicta]|nr:hypothetical protein C8F01DRAFT_495122 [Mycena amicta]
MLFLRLLARANPVVGLRGLVAPATLSRALLAATTRRTFVSSTRLSLPASTTAAKKKPAAKKQAVKKATPAKKKPAAKKATPAKKKPAAKARVVAKKPTTKPKPAVKKKKVVTAKKPVVKKKKKVVPKKVPRITRAMGPPPYGNSPFILFHMEEHAKDPSVEPIARSKQSSVKWKQMSESEKEPYMQRSLEAKEKARIARAKWFDEVDPLFLRRLNAQRRAKNLPRFRNPNKTDRKPLSAYFLFLVEHRATAAPSGTHPREVSKAVGALWRALEPSEKEVYVSKAREEKEAFKRRSNA